MTPERLTSSSLLAAATEALTQSGYTASSVGAVTPSDLSTARTFEDLYGVVSLVVHDTWHSLESTWLDDQARLVDLLTDKIGQVDAKIWDGYLVLLTPTRPVTEEERAAAQRIRHDTSRVRKLVATGEEITSTSDVARALASLLPLPAPAPRGASSGVLEILPSTLEESGVAIETTERLIHAYRRQDPLMPALEPSGGGQ